MKINKGFTLIELMIVVAIIGILSMIAMPAYQVYTKKAYIANGMALFGPIKTASIEHYSVNGQTAARDFVALGFSGAQLSNNNTRMSMAPPLKYIDMKSVKYNNVPENINNFTLVFDETVGKIQNELVMEVYPTTISKETKEVTNAMSRTVCVTYLKTRPQTAIPKKYLPAPCRPSFER